MRSPTMYTSLINTINNGVGGKEVTTDGIIFSLDSSNMKSYLLDTTQVIVTDTENYTPYYGFTPSTTLSIPGNRTAKWTQYIIDNNGSLPINIYGGATGGFETYDVTSVVFQPSYAYLNPGKTVLYNRGNASITITHSCVMDDIWYGGGPLIVKVPGVDLTSLSLYASLNNNSLDLLLSGGISSTISTTASYISYINNCLPAPCGSIPTIPGYSNKIRNNINSQGGSMSVKLTGGTAETYIATGAITTYDPMTWSPITVLYGFGSTYNTYSSSCYISQPWGFNMIIYPGFDLTTFIRIYNNDNISNIAFNLTGGAISEIYYANYAYYNGTDTYIYSSSGIGTLYNDHTNFNIYIRDLNQLSSIDNTIASYYSMVQPEIYSVQQFYFDGSDTYLYDNNGIGALHSGNTQFDANVVSILGTQYDNYTNFTYSHLTYSHTPPTFVSNLKTGNNINPGAYIPVSFNLANGLGSNKREFVFDGIDDYIDVGNLGAFSSFTLDVWFNSSAVVDYKNILDFNGGNTMMRIEQYSSPGYQFNWTNGSTIGRSRMSVNIVYNNVVIPGLFAFGGDYPPYDFSDNTWYNLIAIFDGLTNNFTIYLNGIKYVDQNIPSGWAGYIHNMRIGDGYDYYSRRFQGRIPYVSLYNKSLSESEALINYNTLKWRFI